MAIGELQVLIIKSGERKRMAVGPNPGFTMEMTHGCSCSQIIEIMSDVYGEEMEGHNKFGCSKGIIEDFINYVAYTKIDGKVLWLNAGKGVISDESGYVSLWEDQSGENNDAEQATTGNQPKFTPDGLSGLNVVNFDGDDFLKTNPFALARIYIGY
jgi:hypothetical protein